MKHKLLLATLLLAFAALTILSCNNGSKTGAFDPAATKTAIEQRDQAFTDTLKKGDSVGLANFYTKDAKIMGSDEPSLTGRDKITKDFGELIRAGVTDSKFTTLGVWGTDSLVVEDGLATFKKKNGTMVSKGKYLVVWKKEDGTWKIFRDMYNSDGPLKSK